MTSSGSRKRKLSDDAEQGSSHIPNWEPGSLAAHADVEHFRRLYQNISISESARSHLGDTRANTVIYNFSPSSVDSTGDNQRWENFRRALSFDRMEFRRRAIEPAYGNTCRWVLETEEYLRWRDETFRDEHHGFLWIKGKPGAGKSTIMKFLLEHAQRNMTDHTILSFFFNARGTSLETSAEGLYRSLLLQLLEAVPRLRGIVDIPNLDPKEHVWEVKIVQDLFREALLHSSGSKVIIFIDALDEGEQKDVRDMVAYFARIAANARSNDVPFDLCFASRHYPNITTSHRVEFVVEGQKRHEQDIRIYVAETLNTDSATPSNDLVHRVVAKAKDVFLWAILVVRMLNEQYDKGSASRQLLGILDKIPEDLDELLTAILLKGAPDNYFLPSLLWVLAAHNAWIKEDWFNVHFLYFGILLGAGELESPVWNREDIDLAAMKRFVLHSTKGLVEWRSVKPYQGGSVPQYIHETVRQHLLDGLHRLDIQFIHESVREHLLNGGLTKVFPFLGNNIVATTHAKLMEWCQTYLRMIRPEEMDVPLDPTTGMVAVGMFGDSQTERSKRIKAKFPLVNYVMQATLFHMERAHAADAFDLESIHRFPRKAWINVNNAVGTDRQRLPPSATVVRLLHEEGCHSLALAVSDFFKKSLSQSQTAIGESGGNERHDNFREPTEWDMIVGERMEGFFLMADDADATQ